MSADNFICIKKTEQGYEGYMGFLSDNGEEMPPYYPGQKPLWVVSTLEEACDLASQEHTEYGLCFANIKIQIIEVP